jgi:hypothetical protein
MKQKDAPMANARTASEPTSRLVVIIPDNLHHRLRVLAAEQRSTIAEITREALEREIARRRGSDSPARPLRKASAA